MHRAVHEVVQNGGKIQTVARDMQVDRMTLAKYKKKFIDVQINEQNILVPSNLIPISPSQTLCLNLGWKNNMTIFVDKRCQLSVNESQNRCTCDITYKGVQKIKGVILNHYWYTR